MNNTKKKSIYFIFAAIILPAIISIFALAAKTDYRKNLTVNEYDGIVSYVYGNFPKTKLTNIETTFDALNELKDIYNFDNVYKELELNKISQSFGGYILDFDQYYDGVYVFPRGLKVSIYADYTIESISGNYLKDAAPNNKIIITEKDAISIALLYGGEVINSRLVIYTLDNVVPVFAYEIASTVDFGLNYYINAQSGEIINEISTTSKAMPTPHNTIQTDYFNNQVNITIAKNDDGTYTLMDGYRKINASYTTSSNDYYGTAYKNNTGMFNNKAIKEDHAITAINTIAKAFDFYTNADNVGVSIYGSNNSVQINSFGVSPLSSEKQVNLIIAIDTGYDNAFCITDYPNTNNTTIFLGDKKPYPLGFDVVAHEYQHSINNYEAKLIYQNASGALDEALADIFAALIEGYEMSDEKFWLIGEGIPGNNIIRSAIQPWKYSGCYNALSYQYAFCFQEGEHENHKCDNGGVHGNATIITHAIYNMYKYATENNIPAFNKKNLGIMLYSALQKMPSDCGWTLFADLLTNAVNVLGLQKADAEKLMEVIRYGFIYTGIFYRENNQTVVRFNLGEMHEGEVPEVFAQVVGEKFTIPESNVQHKYGGSFIGWTENFANPSDSEIFYVGEEYIMPPYSMTLYPVSLPARWNNFVFTAWDGNGSEQSPYLIKSKDDLAALAYYMNSGLVPAGATKQEIENKYFKLTSDIDLQSIEWLPIGMFESLVKNIYFDGNNHIISKLKITYSGDYFGLFGILKGEVKNLGIANGTINTDAIVAGGIAGVMSAGSLIKNCYSKVAITNSRVDGIAGGIVGIALSDRAGGNIVLDSVNLGNITADVAGGICGRIIETTLYNKREVQEVRFIGNCINDGLIIGKNVGGILGLGANVVFANCINTGLISGTGYLTSLGGIIGILNYESRLDNTFSAFLSCKNTGIIEKSNGTSYAGGLIGVVFTGINSIIKFENNIIKSQSGVGISGVSIPSNVSSLDGVRISYDSEFTGDFDFDSLEYFYDSSNWSIANGISYLSFLNWEFEEDELPVPKISKVYWYSDKASLFDGGKGTAIDPYRIRTAQQLALLSYNVNYGVKDGDGILYSEKCYLQTSDIDLNGKLWIGIGYTTNSNGYTSFKGVYDGDSYYIKNLVTEEWRENGKLTKAALFTSVESGSVNSVIKNVRLVDIMSEGKEGAAGIAYRISGNTLISNCIVSGSITSLSGAAAGIAAIAERADSTNSLIEIYACLNLSSISAPIAVGILGTAKKLGSSYLTIKSSVNKGVIVNYNAGSYEDWNIAAGIAGIISGRVEISACINGGNISNYGIGYASGICGFLSSGIASVTINSCKQSATVFTPNEENATSILSTYYGNYGPVTITKSHYISIPEVTLIRDASLNNTQEVMSDTFDFSNIEYYKNGTYFAASEDYYELYILMNYEIGHVFAVFFDYNGKPLSIQKIPKGSALTALDDYPLRENNAQYDYTFIGWMGPDGQMFDSTAYIANVDIRFVQKYTEVAHLYTIYLLQKDGSIIETHLYEYDQTIEVADPKKKGYVFEGWYLDSSYTTEAADLTVKGDMNLYAKWSKSKKSCSTITFDLYDFIFITSILLLVFIICAAPYVLKKYKRSK